MFFFITMQHFAFDIKNFFRACKMLFHYDPQSNNKDNNHLNFTFPPFNGIEYNCHRRIKFNI